MTFAAGGFGDNPFKELVENIKRDIDDVTGDIGSSGGNSGHIEEDFKNNGFGINVGKPVSLNKDFLSSVRSISINFMADFMTALYGKNGYVFKFHFRPKLFIVIFNSTFCIFLFLFVFYFLWGYLSYTLYAFDNKNIKLHIVIPAIVALKDDK